MDFDEAWKSQTGAIKTMFALNFRGQFAREEQEDITQNIALTLHRKIHMFRGESKFSVWFYRLAMNEILQAWRYKTQKLDPLRKANSIDYVVLSIPHKEDPHRELEKREQLRKVLASWPVSALGADALALIALDGKWRSLSKECGLSFPSFKSRVHRARADLLATMAKQRLSIDEVLA